MAGNMNRSSRQIMKHRTPKKEAGPLVILLQLLKSIALISTVAKPKVRHSITVSDNRSHMPLGHSFTMKKLSKKIGK